MQSLFSIHLLCKQLALAAGFHVIRHFFGVLFELVSFFARAFF